MGDRPKDQTIHDPGHDAGATLEQTQAGEDLAAQPPPEDMRDMFGNRGPAIGDARPVGDVPFADTAGVNEHVRQDPVRARTRAPSNEPVRDPSLSRAVDRAAAGLEPADAGYDRAFEGEPAGPLGPAEDEVPADAEEGPSGGWGSSG
jgi:hypothetical protein